MNTASRLVNPANVEAIRAAMSTGTPTGSFLPAVYIVEPTSRCNLKCIMCPNSRLTPDKLGDATLEELQNTFKIISRYAELTMLYFMGESTLHPSFAEVLLSARSTLRGRIVLSTNATNLSDEAIAAIVAACDIVIVPIDRWDSEKYSKIRRLAVFNDVVVNAERILAHRGDGEVPTVIVKGLDITPRRSDAPIGSSELAAFDAYWSERRAIPLHGWLNTWAGQMPNLVQLSSGLTPYDPVDRGACADLWFKAVINWRGEVVLCCHNWDYSVRLGTMLSDGLRRVWHSTTLQELRRSHVSGDFSCTEICATCREWGEPDELDAYLDPTGERLYKVF